jgi:hypothetical protein
MRPRVDHAISDLFLALREIVQNPLRLSGMRPTTSGDPSQLVLDPVPTLRHVLLAPRLNRGAPRLLSIAV